MDNSLLELLTKVTLYDLIWALVLVITVISIIVSQRKKISKFLDRWRKEKNEEEDFHALVYALKSSIETLSDEVKRNQANRDQELLRYREDSKKIRDEMYKVMNTQSESIAELKATVLKIQEKNSETKRAEIKEKIERIYRECTHEQACTEMQFESLKDLIEQYEKHGGINSFVHSTVEPEMYRWEIVHEVSHH